MGYLIQLSALFYKNAILARRSIKTHVITLLVLPLIALLPPVIVEVVSNRSATSETWTDMVQAANAASLARFVVLDLIEAGSDARDPIVSQKRIDFVKDLGDVLGDLYKEEDAKDLKTGIDFDEFYVAKLKGKVREYSGAFLLKDIELDPQGNYRYVIVIQASDELTESFMIGKLGLVLMKVVGSGALEHNKMELSNSASYADVFSPNPIITGIASTTFFPVTLVLQMMLKEKEDRVFVLMRLNGLHVMGYLFGQLLWYTLLCLFPLIMEISSLLFLPNMSIISGQFAILLMVLLLVVFNNTSLALLMCTVFNKVAVAIPLAIALAGLAPTIGSLSRIVPLPPYVQLIPILGYNRLLNTLAETKRSFLETLRIADVWVGISALFLHTILFFLLTVYLASVLDQNKSGLVRPWHYLISDRFQRKKKSPRTINEQDAEAVALMDNDVVEQVRSVDDIGVEAATLQKILLFNHVTKQYSRGKLAVEDVCFALGSNQIFGLLGPNGAGKSTLMQMASGLYDATKGDVYIHGLTPSSNPDEFYKLVGFCPQHDIYWHDLTVSEHLRFFEMLRGTSHSKEIESAVSRGMSSVRLLPFANAKAATLSGGERRRLSLAISLAGNSKVVLLDEPTTGLDPKVRRLIWDIIAENRGGRLIIMTTHSMEEAEILSDQLTIMAHGRLRCFGTPDHLKQKFGGQIFVNVTVRKGVNLSQAVEGMKGLLPTGTTIGILYESSDGTNARLIFGGSKAQLLDLMLPLLEAKPRLGIESFGVNQSSLDDVFMNIVKEADADA